MPELLTRQDVADRLDLIERCVGPDPHPTWRNGRLTTAGPDGLTRGAWLIHVPPEQRVEQVREFLASGSFTSVRGVKIKKPGGGHRIISVENTIAHAAGWVLKEALEPAFKPTRSHVAVAYVPGLPLHEAFMRGARMCRTHGGTNAWETDILDFFGTMAFDHLRRRLDHVGAHKHGIRLADDLKDFAMQAAMMPIVDLTGRVLERHGGVPQGIVLAPMLANLYLSETDRNLCRRLANLHVQFLRSSDNYLGVGPSAQACRSALGILDEELARVGLKLKPGATKVRDLRNRANAPTWLGISFTFTGMWVPTDRLQEKAAKIQAEVDAGLLDEDLLNRRLAELRNHYDKTIGPYEAERVEKALRKRLTTDLLWEHGKEDIDNIRRQIAPMFTWSQVTRATALEGDSSEELRHRHRTGQEQPCDGGPCRKTSQDSDQPAREQGQEDRVTFARRSSLTEERDLSDPPERVTSTKDNASPSLSPPGRNEEAQTQDQRDCDSSLLYTSELSPVAPSWNSHTLDGAAPIPPRPGADPATHRRHGPHKGPELALRLLDSWTLRAAPRGRDFVLVAARDRRGGGWRLPEQVEGSRSRTEAFVVGLALGLERLLEEGVGSVELICDDAVVHGYLTGNRIRSHRVAARLGRLEQAIDRFGRDLVAFRVPDGARVGR